MWTVQQPAIDTGNTFDVCTSLIRNPGLRARMRAIRPDVLVRSTDYDTRAAGGEIHLVPRHQSGIGDVAGDDLEKNYTQRMARKGVPARAVYDALKVLPRNNRCPFCNYGAVETLDHFLPKEFYPGLSVKPTNLVGCCDRCNRLKGKITPAGPDDGFLHPYFDDVDHTIWLVADIVTVTPAAATFRVENPGTLNAHLLARIQRQFRELRLRYLYSDAAADEIVNIEDALEDIFEAGGKVAVTEHLARQSSSRRKAKINSWQAALYDALARSPWYCSGGFRSGVDNRRRVVPAAPSRTSLAGAWPST